MNELRERFNAIQDRVNDIERRVQAGNLSNDEKSKLIEELAKCGWGLADIAAAKLDRGDVA